MKILTASVGITLALVCSPLVAQENSKPVPKDSARVFVSGCSKGYVFTAGVRNPDQPGSAAIPEGMHLRMNAPKKMMAEIKAHEGSMIEITGLVKKGQYLPDGVSIGGGVRVGPGPGTNSIGVGNAVSNPISIDVESWRALAGNCPSR